jgi:hypothetical protein
VIGFLRVLFSSIFVFMVVATTKVSLDVNLFSGGAELMRNQWGVMTLFDAYFGFLTFFVWVAYKERTALPRVLWFVLIMLLGNIATSAYMLLQLFLIPAGAPVEQLLLRRPASQRPADEGRG